MESSTPQSISPAIAQSIYSAPIATESVVVSPIRYEPSDEDRKEDIDYTRDREEKDLQLESIDEKGVSAVIAQEFPDGGLYGWLYVEPCLSSALILPLAPMLMSCCAEPWEELGGASGSCCFVFVFFDAFGLTFWTWDFQC